MHVYKYKLVRFEQEGGQQPFLRAELKLLKFLHSTTKYLSLIHEVY